MKNNDPLFQFDKKGIKILECQDVYQGYFKVRKYTLQFRLFQGGWSPIIDRELFIRGKAVGVIAYDPHKDAVVLLEQLRIGALEHPETPWMLEIIAGMVEKDELPEAVAKREAKEEANCDIRSLMPIYQYYSSPGGTSETFHLFCGIVDSAELGGVHGQVDEHENILAHVMPREKAYQLVQQGKIINSHTIIALQWLEMHYQELKKI